MNKEFEKMFGGDIAYQPIMRDLKTKRDWINENLLKVSLSDNSKINIVSALIHIIDAYVQAKTSAFEHFIEYGMKLTRISDGNQ